MNKCPHWQEYPSIAGTISYCEVAAFNKPVPPGELERIGCTEEKRRECLSTMKLNVGQGAVPATVPTTTMDAPKDVAKALLGTCQKKAETPLVPLALLGIMAGAYIALGGELSTVATADLAKYIGEGLTRIVGGAVFSLGLILVVIGGAELFTGNNLMVAGVLEGRISKAQLLRNWTVVYATNFLGAILVVALFYYSGLWRVGGVGLKTVAIASAKVNLAWGEALARGILCNWLVCLAVWMAMAGRDALSKMAAIMFPVMAFVASGFEHSIANMYFVPLGIALKANPEMVATLEAAGLTGLANLNWGTFLWVNLLPVTIGNIVGGTIFVGSAYWYVFRKKEAATARAFSVVPGRVPSAARAES